MGRYRERARRQNMMFSATFAGPVQMMAGDFMHDYLFITVGRVGAASETITQYLIYAEDGRGKINALARAIRDHQPPQGMLSVIFVETKRSADQLEDDLWKSGLRCCAIHGDRSQNEREDALAAFKSGDTPIMVATDVAARGLDISNVGLVINFDMPKQMDDYVHRIGRTGRAGKRGKAIAFVNERCRYLAELGRLLKDANQEVPPWIGALAKEATALGLAKGKGKGKGKAGASFGARDMRVAAGIPKEDAPKEEPKPEPKAPEPPPEHVPDAWDDSDSDVPDAWDAE